MNLSPATSNDRLTEKEWGMALVKILTPRRLGYAYAHLARTILGPTWHVGFFRCGERQQLDCLVPEGVEPYSPIMLARIEGDLPAPDMP